MDASPRGSPAYGREIFTALGVALALGGAIDAINLHRETRQVLRWHPAMDTLRGCLVAAALYACARRWPRLRGAATLALLATAPLLPAWNPGTLHWLGETLVGGWGDGVWCLTAPEIYFGERAVAVYRAPTELAFVACVGVALVAVLFAREAAARLARPAVRSATVVALLAVPAALAVQGAVAHVTRAPFARWWTAYPVVARVPAARVPEARWWTAYSVVPRAPTPRGSDVASSPQGVTRAPEEPCLALTAALCANRPTYDDRPAPTLMLRSTPRAAAGRPRELAFHHLWCPDTRASLTVRTLGPHDRILVACEDPRTGLPWPAPRDPREGESLVEAHGYFARVYTAEALGVAAPPPWATGAAGLGVLAALALVARRRRSWLVAAARAPYRDAPPDGDAAVDRSLAVATDAFAVALAAQAAAPLVLAAWSRLAVFR